MGSAAVIADDATGALEAGARLAEAGCRAEVRFHADFAGAQDRTLVIDTATRHLQSQRAYDSIYSVASSARDAGITDIYKKTDSTLRGPIGAEFGALMDVFPSRRLVYVPAYPATGRTVRGGVLLVHGVPVAETVFAEDARDAVVTSVISDVVRCGRPAVSVRSDDELGMALHSTAAGVLICDAETDGELEAIARVLAACSVPLLVAGPGAFLQWWPGIMQLSRTAAPEWPGARRFLLVCGSLHPVSRAQAEYAAARGATVIESPLQPFCDPEAVVRSLALRAADQLRDAAYDAVVIFGGDTVAALCQELGWRSLAPAGEIMPGVTVAIPPQSRPVVVAKAGGFGPADVFSRIQERLTG